MVTFNVRMLNSTESLRYPDGGKNIRVIKQCPYCKYEGKNQTGQHVPMFNELTAWYCVYCKHKLERKNMIETNK